jgi:hypothetical protein
MTTTMNRNGLPTVDRPCPPWCELKAGHGWGSGTEGVDNSRGHGLLIGDVPGGHCVVSIGTIETSLHGGPSAFTPVTIGVDSALAGTELDVDQAQELADFLNLAIAKVKALRPDPHTAAPPQITRGGVVGSTLRGEHVTLHRLAADCDHVHTPSLAQSSGPSSLALHVRLSGIISATRPRSVPLPPSQG